MQKFDLIVIGSGPAGQRAAIQAAKADKHVALVERREVLGGVCINTGTIPSKTMREAVLHFSGFRYKPIYGVSYQVKEKITMAGPHLPRAARDQERRSTLPRRNWRVTASKCSPAWRASSIPRTSP
jgi:pyruvate/2-oxoglutarate dehydrogenase complex dihydrolipoamide dehydrogenase (E3) component